MGRTLQEGWGAPEGSGCVMPSATYRLQLSPAFGFNRAEGVVAYLAELGISHIYASPIFKARKGSSHGYDVTDYGEINPELGTPQELDDLLSLAASKGLGWIQDIVPNHMAYTPENAMLMDVLENGSMSRYFGWFDAEWNHPNLALKGRILSPFLGRFYGDALEGCEISLVYGKSGFSASYYDIVFPLRVESYTQILLPGIKKLTKKLGENNPDLIKLLGVLYAMKSLSSGSNDTDPDERYEQTRFIKEMLWELYSGNTEIKGYVDQKVSSFNGKAGDPSSFDALDDLLSRQFFRLAFWKVACEEINYRRFFNVNDLIAIRAHEEEVFDRVHSLILSLTRAGKVCGLRVDHVDGLYDPAAYLSKLREKAGDLYLVVEKILAPEERLPSSWPVHGTTGYDFLNRLNGIFCDARGEKTFDRIYASLCGLVAPYEELVFDKKRLIMGKEMAGDVDNVATLMIEAASGFRHGRDITSYGLKRAIVEVLAHFPVYRTYIAESRFSDEDKAYIKSAIDDAKGTMPGLTYEFDFLGDFFLGYRDELKEERQARRMEAIMRFQQLTGPLLAKAFEDTVLYVYNRLLALNEVGGSPDRFGTPIEDFFAFLKDRQRSWPYSMNATSTHDTKRGEDVRCRINVLSEMPLEWERCLRRWSRINRSRKRLIEGYPAPDGNDEYFLYQMLLGAFPLCDSEFSTFIERMKGYIVKAVREAKVHTAWLKPDLEYEEAFVAFMEAALGDAAFIDDFLPFMRRVAFYGAVNSLSQVAIKIASPGVPDFYQGTELWDLSLVDPDNRRPVDFIKRAQMLEDIKRRDGSPALIDELLSGWIDGKIKLFLIYKGLKARKDHERLFATGYFAPLMVRGKLARHVVAFARKGADEWAICIAPRFTSSVVPEGAWPIGEVWADARVILPKGAPKAFDDAITGIHIDAVKAIQVSVALKRFPVALLIGRA